MKLNQIQLTLIYAQKKNNPSLRLGQILCNDYKVSKQTEDEIYELDNHSFNSYIVKNDLVDYSATAKGLEVRNESTS